MRNIKITVMYDGTGYCGWQVQPNGDSIAAEIINAVYKVTSKRPVLYGSGRTDSGVHALAQTANFKTESVISCDKLIAALNANLPSDIRITSACDMPEAFNSRFDAKGKTYFYDIYNARHLNPFYVGRAWLVKQPLDIDKMREAAALIEGKHDFAAFMAAGSYVKDTNRELYSLTVERLPDNASNDSIIRVTAHGNGFLYNMVRIIVGTLVYAGSGKLTPKDVSAIIESRERKGGAPTAPPQGLYLKEVYYEEEDECCLIKNVK